MKAKMQVLGAVALVLVVALGAWNAAFAEKSPAGDGPRLSSLISHLFRADSPEVQVEVQVPQAAEISPVADDHPHPEDAIPEVEDTPEPVESPEAMDDHGGNGEVETHAEISGTVSAIDGTTVTVDGQAFTLAPDAEGLASVQVGDAVKLEFITNPDGSVTVREVKLADASANSSGTSQLPDDSSIRHESGGSDSSDQGGHGGDSGGGSDDGSGG